MPALRLTRTLTAAGTPLPEPEGAACTWARGRANASLLRSALPAPAADVFVCVCGPEPFNEAVKRALLDLGHDARNLHLMS